MTKQCVSHAQRGTVYGCLFIFCHTHTHTMALLLHSSGCGCCPHTCGVLNWPKSRISLHHIMFLLCIFISVSLSVLLSIFLYYLGTYTPRLFLKNMNSLRRKRSRYSEMNVLHIIVKMQCMRLIRQLQITNAMNTSLQLSHSL